jgi:hypothetical protein
MLYRLTRPLSPGQAAEHLDLYRGNGHPDDLRYHVLHDIFVLLLALPRPQVVKGLEAEPVHVNLRFLRRAYREELINSEASVTA